MTFTIFLVKDNEKLGLIQGCHISKILKRISCGTERKVLELCMNLFSDHLKYESLVFYFFQWLGVILFTGIVAGNLLRKEEKEGESL